MDVNGLTRITGEVVGADYDYLLKVLLLGDSGVGKSSMLRRFADPSSDGDVPTVPTIGVDLSVISMRYRNPASSVAAERVIKLQLWDTAGQERFRAITRSYYQGAHAVLVVCALDDRESLRNVHRVWLPEIAKYGREDVQVLLVGNKADLVPGHSWRTAAPAGAGSDAGVGGSVLVGQCTAGQLRTPPHPSRTCVAGAGDLELPAATAVAPVGPCVAPPARADAPALPSARKAAAAKVAPGAAGGGAAIVPMPRARARASAPIRGVSRSAIGPDDPELETICDEYRLDVVATSAREQASVDEAFLTLVRTLMADRLAAEARGEVSRKTKYLPPAGTKLATDDSGASCCTIM